MPTLKRLPVLLTWPEQLQRNRDESRQREREADKPPKPQRTKGWLLVSLEQQLGMLLRRRHRAIELRKFLDTIDEQVPAQLDVHLIMGQPVNVARSRSASHARRVFPRCSPAVAYELLALAIGQLYRFRLV
jgi:hypothetical protein